MRPDGTTGGVYRKIHLVPFGEFVPLQKLLFFAAPLVQAVSDFSAGDEATLLPVGSARKGPNRLYKNLGNGQFRDVTASSGLGFEGFCHGIVVGDLDNDGDPYVFLCNYGPNKLYKNNGDGTFADASPAPAADRLPGYVGADARLALPPAACSFRVRVVHESANCSAPN